MVVVEVYKGVEIISSCGYFYPAPNTNVESKDISFIKDWIDNVYMFYLDSTKLYNAYCELLGRKSKTRFWINFLSKNKLFKR